MGTRTYVHGPSEVVIVMDQEEKGLQPRPFISGRMKERGIRKQDKESSSLAVKG